MSMRQTHYREIPIEARCLIHALAWALPPDYGDRWRREWFGESWHWLNEQRSGFENIGWPTRRRLFGHVVGAIVDVWFLLTGRGLFKRKLECIGRGSLIPTAVLFAAVAALWPFCVNLEAICPSGSDQNAVLIARRNPFMGRLDRLSVVETEFLSGRKDVFDAFGTWRTYTVRLTGSPFPVTVLQIDVAARQLFDLNLEKGAWPTDGHGCEVPVTSSSAASKEILTVNGSRCRVVGIVSRPRTAVPYFTLVVSAESGLPGVLPNVIARLRSGTSEDRLNQVLDVPFDLQRPWLRSGRDLVVTPVKQIRAAPFKWGGAVFLAIWIMTAFLQRLRSLRARIACSFETALALLIVGLPWLKCIAHLPVAFGDVSGITTAVIYGYPVVVGASIALLTLHFQRGCCRVCHRRLVSPMRIGRYGSVLMEPAATESLCTEGHGSLVLSTILWPAQQWLTWCNKWA